MTPWRKRCAGIALMLLLLAGCARTGPEQALREAISGLQATIEKRDASGLQGMLAEDFIGPEGLDRDGARQLAQAMFLRYRGIGVSIGPLDMALQDEHATVRFTAALTGGSDGLLPDSGQAYEVETGWRFDDGQWLMTSATWASRF